jgi:hypothetical protein
MKIQTATNCFNENIRLFGDARSEPEKFNLYNGLSNMAQAIAQLAREVDAIKQTVDRIRRDVR